VPPPVLVVTTKKKYIYKIGKLLKKNY
jgi:hypothetical protein